MTQPELDFTHSHDKTPETYYPSRKTFSKHCMRIYEWMLRGERVTAHTVYQRLGTHKGSTRISDLRNAGVVFQQVMVKSDGGVNYMEYFMSKDDVRHNVSVFGYYQ